MTSAQSWYPIGVVLATLTIFRVSAAGDTGGPVFDSPEAFLRSVYPELRPFGPAGYAGLPEGKAHHVAGTADELTALLAELAKRPAEDRTGTVIGLRAGMVYDVSGVKPVADVPANQAFVAVPDGVTLAAMAGDESPLILYRFPDNFRELLEQNAYAGRHLLDLGAGCRLLGVRIVGPDVPAHEADYETLPRSRFNAVRAARGSVVEHCEISRFHYSGVAVYGRDVIARFNDIFDVHAYPVLVGAAGSVLVEGNRLRWSWHAIAGSGTQGQSYVFRHNVVIHDGPGIGRHAIDMHAWRQMMAAGGAVYPFVSIGGDRMEIVGNVLVNDRALMARWAEQPHRSEAEREQFRERPYTVDVCIRGMPRDLALVRGNWFSNEDEEHTVRLVSQVGEPGQHSRANLWVLDNYYGPDALLRPVGQATRARIHFRDPPLEVMRDAETRRWNTERIAVVPRGTLWRPQIEISMPDNLGIRELVFCLGKLEHRFPSVPEPGTVVFNTEAIDAGIHILTVEVEDERGERSRHDMPVCIEQD